MAIPVAIVQFEPALADLATTLDRLHPLLTESRDAQVTVLPELASSGYALPSRAALLASAEVLGSGPYQTYLTERARRERRWFVTGFAERSAERVYNASVIIGPDGVAGNYRKLHLFGSENDLFSPGDLAPTVVDCGGLNVGQLICFDWRFPEVWRLAALAGADLIAHPSNLVVPELCQRAVPIHALLERVYVATSNRIGSEGGLRFTGRSLAADPRGEILAEATVDRSQVLRFEVDPALARDKRINRWNDLVADRRPDVYGGLLRSSL